MLRKMMRLFLAVAACSACAISVGGVADKAAARAVCDRAMAKVLADDIPGAFAA